MGTRVDPMNPNQIRPKVKAAGLAGTFTAVVLALVEVFNDPAKIDTGDGAIGAAVATLVAVVAAYAKRDQLSPPR